MPRVPNADKARIDPRKITHYLLDETHEKGGPKSVFLKRFGFSRAEWHKLRDVLLEHLRSNDCDSVTLRPFGMSYRVSGVLSTPDGRNPRVAVVWITLHGTDAPLLVTAFPD